MTAPTAEVVLVPGAWMGGWIWEPVARRLIDQDIDATAITLRGLEPGLADTDIAAVRLDDHVRQLVQYVATEDRPVILVSHSYSGMVTALAADRLGGQVIGLIHLGAFVPASGRSLLDDWGSSTADRAQERAEIAAAGDVWPAPTREMLDHEADLSPDERDWLAARFTSHPGLTVLDPAELAASIEQQPTTYVALTPSGGFDEAWDDAPAAAKKVSTWRRAHLVSGHWPMVSALDSTVDLLAGEICHYDSARS